MTNQERLHEMILKTTAMRDEISAMNLGSELADEQHNAFLALEKAIFAVLDLKNVVEILSPDHLSADGD